MKKLYPSAAAVIVVVATIIITLSLIADPTRGQLGALAIVVIAQLYGFGVVFYATWVRRGDRNNFLPAVVAAGLPLIASIVILAVQPVFSITIVSQVLAWAIALIALLISLSANKAEAEQAEHTAAEPNFNPQRGNA